MAVSSFNIAIEDGLYVDGLPMFAHVDQLLHLGSFGGPAFLGETQAHPNLATKELEEHHCHFLTYVALLNHFVGEVMIK